MRFVAWFKAQEDNKKRKIRANDLFWVNLGKFKLELKINAKRSGNYLSKKCLTRIDEK